MEIAGIEIKAGLPKKDEIKIIHALAIEFHGTENYLEHFFSHAVCQQIERDINDDIIPANILDKDVIIQARNVEIESKDKLISELRAALKVQNITIENYAKQLAANEEKHRQKIEVLNESVSTRVEKILRLQDEIVRLREKLEAFDTLTSALRTILK